MRDRKCPAPKTFPPVWIRPSLSNCLSVIDIYPRCSLRHVYLERWDKTTWLHHRLWMFFKTQPLQRLIFFYFLSCFHCRELCGVPETECEQPQPCVPAERHLPRHGILGVSGTWLVSLSCGSAQPTLQEKTWRFLQPGFLASVGIWMHWKPEWSLEVS